MQIFMFHVLYEQNSLPHISIPAEKSFTSRIRLQKGIAMVIIWSLYMTMTDGQLLLNDLRRIISEDN